MIGQVAACSPLIGQSNMEWRVKGVRNAAEELELAALYEEVRLLKIVREVATEPVMEPLGYLTQWTRHAPASDV